MHDVRVGAHRRADDLDAHLPLEHLLPENPQLQLRQPIADAAMHAEAERQVAAHVRPVDDVAVRVLDRRAAGRVVWGADRATAARMRKGLMAVAAPLLPPAGEGGPCEARVG